MIHSSRRAQAERAQSQAVVREVPWPLPLGGLYSDARNSEISGSLAEVMNNWKSNGISLEMRDGFTLQESNTVIQRVGYEFGANPSYIDIYSDKIVIAGSTLAGTFASDFSHTTLSSNVMLADGVNPVLRCNGAQTIDAEITSDTGKASSEFDGLFSHHDRLYAWDSDELAFYYGAVGEVTGELTRFPLDRLGNISGTIKIMHSLTYDAKHGMNDILVIITSTGWIILYEGLDPGDSNDWRLMGRVKTAAPVSKFAIESFGADLWVLTVRGVVSVKDSLAKGALALTSRISQPIADLIIADINAGKTLSGWQMVARPDGTDVLLNVPTGTGYKQYVFTMEIGAWSTSDYQARWWHDDFERLEFTDPTGNLKRVEVGDDGGQDITAIFYTSWVRIPRYSEIAYMIPTIIADSELVVKITVLTDHNKTPDDITEATQTITIKPDTPGSEVSLDEIIAINAIGRVFQARFEISGKNLSFENLVVGLV